MVVVNCAALPENLLESELFGHVRGAFTGATTTKPGRVELAEGGTLFLDEIAEMSPMLQAKLLRLLQEREYQPVGSSATRKADARFIAATHQDLDARVKDGSFREDLYFRLAVVPARDPTAARAAQRHRDSRASILRSGARRARSDGVDADRRRRGEPSGRCRGPATSASFRTRSNGSSFSDRVHGSTHESWRACWARNRRPKGTTCALACVARNEARWWRRSSRPTTGPRPRECSESVGRTLYNKLEEHQLL